MPRANVYKLRSPKLGLNICGRPNRGNETKYSIKLQSSSAKIAGTCPRLRSCLLPTALLSATQRKRVSILCLRVASSTSSTKSQYRRSYHPCPDPRTGRLRKSRLIRSRNRIVPSLHALLSLEPQLRLCQNSAHIPTIQHDLCRHGAVLPQLLDLAGSTGHIPGGPVYSGRVSRTGLWDAIAGGAGKGDGASGWEEIGVECVEVE